MYAHIYIRQDTAAIMQGTGVSICGVRPEEEEEEEEEEDGGSPYSYRLSSPLPHIHHPLTSVVLVGLCRSVGHSRRLVPTFLFYLSVCFYVSVCLSVCFFRCLLLFRGISVCCVASHTHTPTPHHNAHTHTHTHTNTRTHTNCLVYFSFFKVAYDIENKKERKESCVTNMTIIYINKDNSFTASVLTKPLYL